MNSETRIMGEVRKGRGDRKSSAGVAVLVKGLIWEMNKAERVTCTIAWCGLTLKISSSFSHDFCAVPESVVLACDGVGGIATYTSKA